MPAKEVELVKVTPELAREWLVLNTRNRNMRQAVVRAYAADMLTGNWEWNGESIKFATDGSLLDGQHRLAAIAESGVTLSILVVRGLDASSQDTVDGGAKRKFSDVLKLRGERNPLLLAAIARRIVLWEAGTRSMDGRAKQTPTNSQMLKVIETDPCIRDIAGPSAQVATHCSLPASLIGFAWWLFAQTGPDDCEFFFARLSDGQGLVKGDPIYELRRAAENSRNVRGERSDRYLAAILIKAWNAYRDGSQIALLTFRPGGARPEKFPEPR